MHYGKKNEACRASILFYTRSILQATANTISKLKKGDFKMRFTLS